MVPGSALLGNYGYKALNTSFGQYGQNNAYNNPIYYYQGSQNGVRPLGYGPFGQLPNSPFQYSDDSLLSGSSSSRSSSSSNSSSQNSYKPPEGIYYFHDVNTGRPYTGFTFSPNLPDYKLPSYNAATKKSYNVDLSSIIPRSWPTLSGSKLELEKLVTFSNDETDSKSYLNRTQHFMERLIPLYPYYFDTPTSQRSSSSS